MTYEELSELLSGVKGSTFVGLDTETIPKLKGGKKNEMQGKVRKVVSNANTMIFNNVDGPAYEKMVKRRMEKEGKDPETFTVSKRAWGTRVGNTCFIEHNGNHYLEVFYLHPGKTEYYLEDEEIDKDSIEGLNTSAPKEESQGGIENKVQVRTIKIDSIKGVRVNNQKME